MSGQLSDFLDDNLYLKLRNQFIRILPQHWIDRIVNMITFQAGRYRGSDISKLCRLNGNQFASLAEMAIYVCDQALDDVKQQKTRAAKALNSFFQGTLKISFENAKRIKDSIFRHFCTTFPYIAQLLKIVKLFFVLIMWFKKLSNVR